MPEFDYLLFSSKSKSISSSRIHKNKENKRSYSNSLINIYALCLFAVEFYRFNETDDLDNIFYPHIGSKASDLKQVKKDMERIEMLKELFLPISYETDIFWKYHFGIVGVKESMKIGKMALY